MTVEELLGKTVAEAARLRELIDILFTAGEYYEGLNTEAYVKQELQKLDNKELTQMNNHTAISFRPLRPQYLSDEVLVIPSQVTYVSSHESGGYAGSKIYFANGESVLVGDWISDVKKALGGL